MTGLSDFFFIVRGAGADSYMPVDMVNTRILAKFRFDPKCCLCAGYHSVLKTVAGGDIGGHRNTS